MALHTRRPSRYVALDIETCPLPLDDLAPALHSRFERRMQTEAARAWEEPADVASRVRSVDPALGWICCIGVASTAGPGPPRDSRPFIASHPGEEAEMLRDFWAAVEAFNRKHANAQWVTFNGKDFDVPRLLLRSAVHGIEPVACGLLNTYPYASRPRCDLMHLVGGRTNLSLEGLCAVLGVPSPKEEQVGGDGVSDAEASGDLASVATYCGADVKATMACFDRLQAYESAVADSPRSRDVGAHASGGSAAGLRPHSRTLSQDQLRSYNTCILIRS